MIKYSNYRRFLDIHRSLCKQNEVTSAKIHKQNFNVGTVTTISDGIELHLPTLKELNLIDGKISLSYEALPYLFFLDGHDKNLLLFLIAYYIQDNYSFQWNRVVGEQYADFFETIKGTRPTWDTTRQSIYSLEGMNIVRKKNSKTYLINPLIIHGSTYEKNRMIKEFTELKEGANVFNALFTE